MKPHPFQTRPSTEPSAEPHSHRSRRALPILARLALAAGCVALASCGSTIQQAPPAGMAVLDATPDAEHRDRIDGIELVSINDRKVRGSEQTLRPGHNRVRVGFNWPQGGDEEVDLEFQTRPNTIYAIYYDVYPPYTERLTQPGTLDAATGGLFRASAEMDRAAFLMLPPIAALGSAAIATRVGNEVAENSRAAQYVDVRVVAQRCSQGVACTRRVFPDGRVEKR